ncbi:N-acetyltransferase esco2 [Cichlidogyrus casuarinus]|uniref:N-acetyltransferase esco2 n=1 Tax=Cichlidogyrus casuarinus TaxID=1844966 RepID=A0ABD2PN43_9PLAT
MRLVDSELGTDSVFWTDPDAFKIPKNFQVYVYVSKSPKFQAIGCAIVEILSAKYCSDNQIYLRKCTSATDYGLEAVDWPSGFSRLLGIRRIWVAKPFRRFNIATSLLDSARLKACLDKNITKDEVVFAEPTEDGVNFAKSYLNTQTLLVY